MVFLKTSRLAIAGTVLGALSNVALAVNPPVKVMQINTWMQGGVVTNGEQMIFDRVRDYEPDIVLFCEVQHAKAFGESFIAYMKEHKLHYEVDSATSGNMVASKYHIVRSGTCKSGTYAELEHDGRTILACSLHLYYCDYACYLPRGYHGKTWKKLEKPESDVKKVIEMNLHSERYLAVEDALKVARPYRDKGDLVIIGGDFNEPSHLDWTERTKNLYDHNGIVMPWHSTLALEKGGYQDTYREKFPDEVKYPGFTFPMNNTAVPEAKLSWAPDADERDRIDFLFYNTNAPGKLTRAAMRGPDTTIVRGKRDAAPLPGERIRFNGNWPTDHAATIAEFEFVKK